MTLAQNAQLRASRGRFEPKHMISIFFKTTGMVHMDCMERGSTINANYYIENCLKPVIRVVNGQRPTSGTTSMKILHDNARPHVTKTVKDCLNQAGITIATAVFARHGSIRFFAFRPDQTSA